MRPVVTKKDFVRRFMANEFGNRGPTWDTLAEFTQSGYSGLLHIRNRKAGGPTYYNVHSAELLNIWLKYAHNPSEFYIAAMAPTDKTTFQGEVTIGNCGVELTYSTVVAPMREALAKNTQISQGIMALSLMRHYMDPSSYDWAQELLVTYPGHIVEFSCYSVNWGTIPHRNTVIWEVRGGY